MLSVAVRRVLDAVINVRLMQVFSLSLVFHSFVVRVVRIVLVSLAFALLDDEVAIHGAGRIRAILFMDDSEKYGAAYFGTTVTREGAFGGTLTYFG